MRGEGRKNMTTKLLTVKDIVLEYLEAHGYDGLYYEGLHLGDECFCLKDDLMPYCEGSGATCHPGHKGSWHAIYPEKQTAEETDALTEKERTSC
jgi:hypothetical protein